MPDNSHYFDSDPDWAAFAETRGYGLLPGPHEDVTLDLASDRAGQEIQESAWAASHSLSSVGYESVHASAPAQDGFEIPIKISRPVASRVPQGEKLPLLFVTHGGGFVQGTHVTEEAWLLWPLYTKFDVVIVSVEYRLCPEHDAPTFTDDSWDALTDVLARSDEFRFDLDRVVLAGSSAGAGVAATLSQAARDAGVAIHGVLLNVPVLCDYRHFPASEYSYTSYEQSGGAFLSSGVMRAVWDLVAPSPTAGADPKLSPFLGRLDGLPMHLVYVAGQDPLRDEGIAYAEKLAKAGVETRTVVYPGVPHNFGEFWELTSTQRWWQDLEMGFREMLNR